MNSDQVKQPFEIYEREVGKYLPKTPASSMLQLLCNCGRHPVCNKEVQELLNINRPSATKLLNKLCRAGVTQHSESQEDIGRIELTDHGRKFLTDLGLAMRTIAATIPTHEKSETEVLQHADSTSEEPSNSAAKIRLDDLEAGIGNLISKLHAKPAGQSEEPKSELPPKRPPMRVSGCRRRQHVDIDGQLPLELDKFAA